MFSPSRDMGDEARNWHSLSGKSISSLVMLAFLGTKSYANMKDGPWRRVSTEDLMSNCSAGEASWEFLGLQGGQTSQSLRKSTYSLEGLVLKQKLQSFGHLMWRANSLEKTLMLGKSEGKRRRERQRLRWLDSITDSMGMNFGKLLEIVKNREAWHDVVHGITKSQNAT